MNKKTDTMSRISLFLSIALLATSSTALAEKFYKWVDENGVTHYGAQAPHDQDASEVNTRTNASSSQGDAIDALNTRRQADAERRAKEQEAAAKAAEEARKLADNPQAVGEERCEGHRKNLETLQIRSVVRRENPQTGELEVLEPEQREALIEESRKALEQCEQQ